MNKLKFATSTNQKRAGIRRIVLLGGLCLLLGGLYLLPVGRAPAAEPVAIWPAEAKEAWTGRLERVEGALALLTVRGSPAERGTAHGKLLGAETRALVQAVREFTAPDTEKCLAGAREMRAFIDPDVIEELNACAQAAQVPADDLLLAQLFGDVNRALKFRSYCSCFAAFGPATQDGKLVVGRNLDYYVKGLSGLPLILQEIPTGEKAGRSFAMVGYAGILAGWTALNRDGLYASNNTLFGGVDSLKGMATCFLLRAIVSRAGTMEEGVELLRKTPRACTTSILIAGRNARKEWDARLVEFDSADLAVVEPQNGLVLGTNNRQKLPMPGITPQGEPSCPRYQTLKDLIQKTYTGRLSFDRPEQKTVDAQNVYLSINLHCVILEPGSQRLRLAVRTDAQVPAAESVFRTFQLDEAGIRQLK